MIFKLRHQKTQQAIPVPPGSHVIGRDDQADLRFEDISISRRHARLTNENNLILVEDLGSSNGTTIKGQKITAPVELKFGDVVDFGNASFRIEPEVVGEISSAPPPALKRALVPVAQPALEKKLHRQTAKLDLPPASGDIPRARAVVMPEVPPQVVPKASSRRIDLPPAGESGPVFSPKPSSASARPASVVNKGGAQLAPVPSRMDALSPKVSGPMPVVPAMTKSAPPVPAARSQAIANHQHEEEEVYEEEEQPQAPVPQQLPPEARRSAALPPYTPPVAQAQQPVPGPSLSPLATPGLAPEKNPFAAASLSRKEVAAAQLPHAPQAPVNEANAPSLVNMLPSAQPRQGWMSERQALPIWVNFVLAFGAGVGVGVILGIMIVKFFLEAKLGMGT